MTKSKIHQVSFKHVLLGTVAYMPTLSVVLFLANETTLQLALPLLVTYLVIKYAFSILDKEDQQRVKIERALVRFWLGLYDILIHPINFYCERFSKFYSLISHD